VSTVAERPSGWSTSVADAVLAPFSSAGVIGNFEVQLVTAALRALGPSGDRPSDGALLALALVARSTRLGHVCLELSRVRRQVEASLDDDGQPSDLPVPDSTAWVRELRDSPLVSSAGMAGASPLRPLVLVGDRLYLQRYWAFEVTVAAQLAERRARADGVTPDPAQRVATDAALAAVFGPDPGADGMDRDADPQRLAARRALSFPVSVVSGGPGTGKTHTVSRILAAAHLAARDRGEGFRAALAAPTGKAANRMREAVGEQVVGLEAAGTIDPELGDVLRSTVPTTLHRLLGATGRTGFRHDAAHPLPVDLVVVDETSMVSLPLLARLLDAVRPEARLVLVGDPFQLTSIEAGTVMADLVGPGGDLPGRPDLPLAGRVTELRRGYRFTAGSATATLALAIRDGDADRVVELLSEGGPEVHWVTPGDAAGLSDLRDQVVSAAHRTVSAALDGRERESLVAAQSVKVLAAVRLGPNGRDEWSALIGDAVTGDVPVGRRGGWPRVGTPVMVTRNDPVNDVANGDVGVVVDEDSTSWVLLGGPDELRRLAPARLGSWEPWWAMTIHKSQGSEFPHAVVALPTVDSPILTRELLYTAVTRAKPEVTVVGSEQMIRTAVARPVARASGLRDRLWPGAGVSRA